MTQQVQIARSDDASGRGSVSGFVTSPARMQPYGEDEINAVVRVMLDAEVQTQGKYLRQFEEDFRTYTGARHAFAVDNCTNALRLLPSCAVWVRGMRSIIPAYTFCATAIPFGATGAQIVWADMDAATWNINPEDVERKITDRTKAIVAVHLLGMPAPMPAIVEIAQRHGLRVVEDCAQAPGAIGHFAAFVLNGERHLWRLRMLQLSWREEHDHPEGRRSADRQIWTRMLRWRPGLRHNGCRGFPTGASATGLPAMSNVDPCTSRVSGRTTSASARPSAHWAARPRSGSTPPMTP